MMVGGYYLSIFIGAMVSGWLGRFYEVLSPAAFWGVHGAIVTGGGIAILLLRRLARILAGPPQVLPRA